MEMTREYIIILRKLQFHLYINADLNVKYNFNQINFNYKLHHFDIYML